jgi:hypothetical protein
MTYRFAPSLLLTLLLAACGGSGSDGQEALTSVSPEASGANCSSGGNRIDTGLDANRDGLLSADEVSSTRYVCNGAGVKWVAANADVEAVANTGYIATNDTTQVKITLPANPAIGEVTRVAGAGQGGWKIAQRDGQSIKLDDMAGETWTPHAVPTPDSV